MILGVDIGGTFTDFVLLQDGHITVSKLPTTPEDPSRALLAGVAQVGVPHTLIHGTTIATNALLERRGAKTALLTTAGFADVLVLGRGTRPSLYDLDVERAPPLVPTELRLEVPERVAADGTIIVPLDEDALAALFQQVFDARVEAVALCLLHSFRNPTHEQHIVALFHAAQQHRASEPCFICASSDVLPEYREYERTSTTVVNAYVAPVLDRYLHRIERELEQQPGPHGRSPSLHVMASDGGSMTATVARRLAARTTLSGPAGGVVGARFVAQQAGFERIISFDMGGTSTDVALCDGRLPQTTESSVGGLPVRFPAIDIHTVGAGGGSLARRDMGGMLRVGPQSAGADPGPACYGKGLLPTVTDANLFLGRLQPDRFLGGTMHLDGARAELSLSALAQQLDLDVRSTALGIVQVANAAMERAIRTISVERGIDPRDFVLVAFGGAGPLHAAYLAESLGIRAVLIPRYPGVLSALGMLTANLTRDYVCALGMPLANLPPDTLYAHMLRLAEQAEVESAQDTSSHEPSLLRAEFTLDLRYVGQSHEINTPLAVWEALLPSLPDLATTTSRFHQLHQQYSGHALPDHPVEAVTLRLKCIREQNQTGATLRNNTTVPPRPAEHPLCPCAHVQAALATDSSDLLDTAIYERELLCSGDHVLGPAIVVQYDTTCSIPPGWQGIVDRYGNLLLSVAL